MTHLVPQCVEEPSPVASTLVPSQVSASYVGPWVSVSTVPVRWAILFWLQPHCCLLVTPYGSPCHTCILSLCLAPPGSHE